jgi:hypothetical protein
MTRSDSSCISRSVIDHPASFVAQPTTLGIGFGFQMRQASPHCPAA